MKLNKFYLTNWLSNPIPELPSSKAPINNSVSTSSPIPTSKKNEEGFNSNHNTSPKLKNNLNMKAQRNKKKQPKASPNQQLSQQVEDQYSGLSKGLKDGIAQGLSTGRTKGSNAYNEHNLHNLSHYSNFNVKDQFTNQNQQRQGIQSPSIKSKSRNQKTDYNSFANKNTLSKEDSNLSKKRKKNEDFDKRERKKLALQTTIPVLPAIDNLKAKPLIGTCEILEKEYVRLTSDPDPSTVRPQPVLEQTLKLLKHKYINERADYVYMCSQLKSMRQDLTVQFIRNEFTVRVYESHARISLQNNDLDQFNQCQGQLKSLYAQNIPGNMFEFTAYRLMYNGLVRNHASLTADLKELSETAKNDPLIKYAIRVLKALNEGNLYLLFGELLEIAPKMSADLILLFAPKLRENYLFALAKAHGPTSIPKNFIQNILGLSTIEYNEFMTKYKLPPEQESYLSKDIMTKIREYRETQ